VAWQTSGVGQSAAVLHACGLATQVPLLPGWYAGVGHFMFGAQAGVATGIMSITQSKSTLGQSATLVQTIGFGSQTPVTLVGGGLVSTGNPASETANGTGAPASTARTGGADAEPQLVPSGLRQGLSVTVPVPELPTLPPVAERVATKLH
jgi:hypothetical protein